VNETGMDHPFHLHGFFFQVIAIDGVPSHPETASMAPRPRCECPHSSRAPSGRACRTSGPRRASCRSSSWRCARARPARSAPLQNVTGMSIIPRSSVR
jgi:FtsP/CotA-like multicopper oxidase with cupredoxin domain